MAKVSLRLTKLSISEKVQFGRGVVVAMTEHLSLFPEPDPAISELKGIVDQLEIEQQKAETGGKAEKAARDEMEKVFDEAITREALYVQLASRGKTEFILLAGMSVKKQAPRKYETINPPMGLEIGYTKNTGELKLRWSKVFNAKSYVVQCCIDPITAEGWKEKCTSTKISCLITGLTSSDKMWFRVNAVGAAGESTWSDPAYKVVP